MTPVATGRFTITPYTTFAARRVFARVDAADGQVFYLAHGEFYAPAWRKHCTCSHPNCEHLAAYYRAYPRRGL